MTLKHFWHAVSNVRPVIWITVYVALVPLFALFYWLLPSADFHVPADGATTYGGCLYYSIVTITTLGFGDYTPAAPPSQWLTAIEVMCGLLTIGFFLNAVGSMKSEIDVETELEKQKRVHQLQETGKLVKNIPVAIHKLNLFLSYCYAVTTPLAKRDSRLTFNADFTTDDMVDMDKPAAIPQDNSKSPAVERLMRCADSTCLFLDSLQARIDLSIWPGLLEDCFAFVANFQMLSPMESTGKPVSETAEFIRNNARIARDIELRLTSIADSAQNSQPVK